MSLDFKIKLAIFFFLPLFIHPPIISASILINEILPHPSSGADWVELYNTEATELDISGWRIQDSTGDLTPFPEGTKFSSSSAFYQVFASNRFNNGGDSIKLKDKDGNVLDEKVYNLDPGEDKSFGRYPDGSDNWGALTSSSANNQNSSLMPSLTITPTVIPTAVPTVASTSTPVNTIVSSLTPKPQATATKYISPTVKVTFTPASVSDRSEGIVLGEIAETLVTPVEEKIAGVNQKNSFPVFQVLLGSGIIFIAAAAVVSIKQIKSKQKSN